MSLTAAALQIATVKALKAANVSAVVFDSAADPRKLQDEPQPVVIVAAVAGKMNSDAREFFGGTHVVDLYLDFGVARRVTRRVGNGDDAVEIDFPDTDSGHDLALHTLAYECLKVLFGTNDPWAEIWRSLWANLGREDYCEWTRGASADKGTRLAVLRLDLKLEAIDEPTPGAEAVGAWDNLLTAMEADASLQKLAQVWRALIETPALPTWRQMQAALGLTLAGARGTGVAPIEGAEQPDNEGDAPAATEGAADDADLEGAIAVTDEGATWTPDGGEAVPLKETE